MAITPEDLGHRLTQAREAAGLSQIQVANYLSVSRQSVSSLEQGHRPIDLPTLHRLMELYGVSLSWLVGDAKPTASTLRDGVAGYAPDLSTRDWKTISGVRRIAMNLNDLNQLLGVEDE